MASNQELRLQQAVDGYQSGQYSSIRAAAAANDVPHNTLQRRLQGGLSRSLAREQQQLLSNEQEHLLKSWIIDLERQGHAPTFATVRELVIVVSKASGGPEKIGHNWIPRFLQRHPEIRSKVGKKIQAQRIDCTTPEILEAWFRSFEAIRQQYGIQWKNTWNMDETGVALGVCSNGRVLGTSAITSCYKKTPENREWSTILETISAIGARLRALVIFKG